MEDTSAGYETLTGPSIQIVELVVISCHGIIAIVVMLLDLEIIADNEELYENLKGSQLPTS